MKPSIKNAIPQLCLTLLSVALLTVPNIAFAQQIDTPMGDTLYTVSSWMTGNVGKGLATIAIAIIGIYALLGRMSWATAAAAGSGIAVIFGAVAIDYRLMCAGDTACIQAQMIADATDAAEKDAAGQAAAAAAQQAAASGSQAGGDAAYTQAHGTPYDQGDSYDDQQQAAASSYASAADSDAATISRLSGAASIAADLHNLLASEGLGNTVAALNAATQAQQDMAQAQTEEDAMASDLNQARNSLAAVADNPTGPVQWGTLFSAVDGSGMDSLFAAQLLLYGPTADTYGFAGGNYAYAATATTWQETGDGWAASMAGGSIGDLFTAAYAAQGAAGAADTAAANNPGNYALTSAALTATINAENADMAADTAIGDVAAADAEGAAKSATIATQNRLAAQQAVAAMR